MLFNFSVFVVIIGYIFCADSVFFFISLSLSISFALCFFCFFDFFIHLVLVKWFRVPLIVIGIVLGKRILRISASFSLSLFSFSAFVFFFVNIFFKKSFNYRLYIFLT